MYIALLAIPVPEENLAAYRAWAQRSAHIFKRYGCLEVLDGWGDFVPRGTRTDFYRAVDARDGETIVCSLQVWPDKATFFAAEEKMHEDAVLDDGGEPPFDAARLITGCFEEIYSMGRGG